LQSYKESLRLLVLRALKTFYIVGSKAYTILRSFLVGLIFFLYIGKSKESLL